MLKRCLLLTAVLTLSSLVLAQDLSSRPAATGPEITPAQGKMPNSEATYQQLRHVTVSGESTATNNLVLKRDAGTFTFHSGALYWLAPVNGKVTGAVFIGDGSFNLVPPLPSEKRMVSLLTKTPSVDETFNTAVFRFTDGTYQELKKQAGSSNGAASGADDLKDINNALRTKFKYNLHGRILEDVLSTEPGGLFVAFIKGKKYNGKEVYFIDPHGALYLEPEEVAFLTWDESKEGVWAAFHYSQEYATGQASGTQMNGEIDIQHQKLDTTIEKSGKLDGDATTTLVAQHNGLRVVPFDLFSTLRVASVTGQDGQALDFIQEDKDEDADFFVILPKALNKGEAYTLRTVYSGKDAVSNEGGGNYFPIARENWYPNTNFGDYTSYDLEFRIPKKMTMVATGTLLKQADEGDFNVSTWKSEVPQAVAGFNFGRFKEKEVKLDKLGYKVQAFANESQPDWVRSLQMAAQGDALPGQGSDRLLSGGPQVALGTMDTTQMLNRELAEAQLSSQLYTDYFGKVAYKDLAVTQQTACTFGQAWPGLVYLPICSFFDNTVKHEIGLDDPRGYWKIVGPHEMAHQWWGHTVGFHSYRDQWMSEGFAEMSASLFIQLIQKNPQEFIKFWDDERELLTERTRYGFRAIDAGPVTLAYRLNNSKTGYEITRRLIYPKGAYILHMIRMMMWNSKTADDQFRSLMKDFVSTYANRTASTEDFKAMVEKHMTPDMDVDGNHRMDWFFNEYVYGTELPTYHFEQSVSRDANGIVMLKMKVSQQNVSPDFKMLVPVYLDFGDGKVGRLGALRLVGNTTFEQTVPLGNMKDTPKRAVISYFDDVLGLTE